MGSASYFIGNRGPVSSHHRQGSRMGISGWKIWIEIDDQIHAI